MSETCKHQIYVKAYVKDLMYPNSLPKEVFYCLDCKRILSIYELGTYQTFQVGPK